MRKSYTFDFFSFMYSDSSIVFNHATTATRQGSNGPCMIDNTLDWIESAERSDRCEIAISFC